jgi:hypothetical protein
MLSEETTWDSVNFQALLVGFFKLLAVSEKIE